jgi:Kef-type K+ transport system membrane component KefB
MDSIAERLPNFNWYLIRDAAGPVFLILGPLLLIRRSWQRAGTVIAALGCCILSVAAGWMLIDTALHENASNRAFSLSVAGVICAVAFLADLAGVRLWLVAFRRPI